MNSKTIKKSEMWERARENNCPQCGSSDITVTDGYTKNCLTVKCNKCQKESVYCITGIVLDDTKGIELGKNGLKNKEDKKWN
jgi:hypothetical protein